jgi:hypothetical protein
MIADPMDLRLYRNMPRARDNVSRIRAATMPKIMGARRVGHKAGAFS